MTIPRSVTVRMMELNVDTGSNDWDPVEAEAVLEAIKGERKSVRVETPGGIWQR